MLMLIFCLHSPEGPDGERGNEAALPAAGTRLSHPQLPEPHSGESAATGRPVSEAACTQDVTRQDNRECEVQVQHLKTE